MNNWYNPGYGVPPFGFVDPMAFYMPPPFIVPPAAFQAPIVDSYVTGEQNSAPQGQAPEKPDNSHSEERGSNAFTSFFKGLVSPVTTSIKTMFSSTTNFLIGAGLLGGGFLLLHRYGKVLAPILTIGGALLGGYQALTGFKKISEADTPEEKQEGYYKLGSATANFGLAGIGAVGTFASSATKAGSGSSLATLGPLHEPLHLLQFGSAAKSNPEEH